MPWSRTIRPDSLASPGVTSVKARGKKPRQRKRRYRPVVDRGCSNKKAHKTQAEAQVVVDQIKARRVFILGLGAPSTYRCGPLWLLAPRLGCPRAAGHQYEKTMRDMRPAH